MPKEQPINDNKSSISRATSYEEMSDFWDEHSLTDYWDLTEPVEFEVNLSTEEIYKITETNLEELVELAKVTEEKIHKFNQDSQKRAEKWQAWADKKRR